ncbi:Uncharacterised protein [Mycobacteroides abscessus subsp. bolletii]|uniref:hypothetical protein n=1 Tax=Mycobacteroides abscessus TaxID=36809 RepID=UPI0009A7946E|nr:hypothetical protein [Mycobacteroides abscessus]SKG98522.1 Uncharacterised protein [Mycobacteroides abscessus subsp. bolletii]SKY52509.1 Uncharacterised protein [Mycobacteroides abscessus subsp. bolletii]SLF02290.1 Uncharacterised protein [Mycobacteroides abscessus subsp. bolletii]
MRGYWYIIGATLIAVGLIGGIGLFVGGLMPVLQGPTSQFDANGSSTTRFGSGDSMIIYVADVEPVPKLTQNTRCVARDENNNEATVSRYDGTLSINQWHALYVVRAHQAGNYTISCAGYSDITYGLGPRAGQGAITAVLLGPIGGITLIGAGIIVLIITALRRRKPTPPPPQHPYGNPYPYGPGPQ